MLDYKFKRLIFNKKLKESPKHIVHLCRTKRQPTSGETMDSEQQFKEIRTLCVLMIDKLDKISAEFREMFGAHKRNSDDIILDYQDVCQILHISLRHLRRLANSNELPGFKIGRRRFWRNYDVQEYIRKIEKNKNR